MRRNGNTPLHPLKQLILTQLQGTNASILRIAAIVLVSIQSTHPNADAISQLFYVASRSRSRTVAATCGCVMLVIRLDRKGTWS